MGERLKLQKVGAMESVHDEGSTSMFHKFTIVLWLMISGLTVAEAKIYRSGREICHPNFEPIRDEHGFWVESEGTEIYAWSPQPFSVSKKTMIFVAGGPGDQSHESAFRLKDWNVIFFDQRGISCSRPKTEKQFLDRSFYGSMKTVADIEAIRKTLKVEQISIYGVSYGTVPAHLYASLFPERTRGLVLEGVVAKSDAKTLIENPHRRQMLQSFFDSLPRKTQDRILELSRDENLPRTWFSQVGKMMFYLDQGEDAFRQFLDGVLWQEGALESLLPGFADKAPTDLEFGFGAVAMQMLSCQEMGMNTAGTSFNSFFEGRTLVPEKNSVVRETYCAPLGFQESDQATVFEAEKFSLTVPVAYVQGAKDGSTSPDQALASYQKAARGRAQLISVREGGHMPLQGPLASGYEAGPRTELRQELLSVALEGKLVSRKLLQEVSAVTEMSWVRKTKNF